MTRLDALQGKKVVVFCMGGNSRSVGLAYVLKRRKIDALAAGLGWNTRATAQMLIDWADVVVLMTESLRRRLPPTEKPVWVCEVGADTYSHLDRKLKDTAYLWVGTELPDAP
jgi:predicted protein tyrosine phosphatase